MQKMATMNPERTCPDCSYRTSSPAASLCPLCNVPLVVRERAWAPVRRPLPVPCALQAADEPGGRMQVVVRDLSVRGARLEHRKPLRLGWTYLLRLPRKDQAEGLGVAVRVLWSSPRPIAPQGKPGPTYHSGVEFQDLAATVDRELTGYVEGPGETCPGPLQGSLAPLPD